MEDRLEFREDFEAAIQESEREMAAGQRPRVRKPRFSISWRWATGVRYTGTFELPSGPASLPEAVDFNRSGGHDLTPQGQTLTPKGSGGWRKRGRRPHWSVGASTSTEPAGRDLWAGHAAQDDRTPGTVLPV